MNLREWRKTKELSQEQLGRKLGLGDKWKTYQSYESGRTEPPQSIKDKLRKMEFQGPWPYEEGSALVTVAEPAVPYLRDYNPGEYAAEAYAIVAEAARAGGADLAQLDQDLVKAAIAATADAVAQGRGEEARLRLVRRAEALLQVHRK